MKIISIFEFNSRSNRKKITRKIKSAQTDSCKRKKERKRRSLIRYSIKESLIRQEKKEIQFATPPNMCCVAV